MTQRDAAAALACEDCASLQARGFRSIKRLRIRVSHIPGQMSRVECRMSQIALRKSHFSGHLSQFTSRFVAFHFRMCDLRVTFNSKVVNKRRVGTALCKTCRATEYRDRFTVLGVKRK
jgi:hypothetical protein